MSLRDRQADIVSTAIRGSRSWAAAVWLLAAALSFAAGAHGKRPEPPGLFRAAAGKPIQRLPAQAIPNRSRTVRINHGVLRSGRLHLDLPGGISMEAVRDLQQEMGGRRFSWVGHAPDDPDSRVVIGVSRNTVAGTFSYRGRLFKLEPRANGSHVLSEVLTSDPAPALEPIPVGDPVRSEVVEADAPADVDGTPVIDVMVGYTRQVQSLYGGDTGADAHIIQAIAETNQAYANSGIMPRLNLVHTVVVDYTESGSMITDLGRLQNTSDGYMDELQGLRDDYGADLVSLIVDSAPGCGLAYIMDTLAAYFANYAFSVVQHDCATSYYSFAHELGHNQGANHDPDNAGSAIYPYAYGYQDPFGAFRTVMATSCSDYCARIDHFSNPEIQYNGSATGISGLSDNVRTINNTAATIAGFRQPVNQSPPTAPSDLTGIATSSSEIGLQWSDNASDESGFHLERSENGVDFTMVAALPTNTSGYVDDNLFADTLYWYRVRAWNSSGSSDYSDTAVIATDTPLPAAPTGLSATAAGSDTITLNWTDASHTETGFLIERRRDDSLLWRQIDTVPTNTANYTDQELLSSTRYHYRVAAVNDAGASDYSNSDSARTTGVIPEWIWYKGSPTGRPGG